MSKTTPAPGPTVEKLTLPELKRLLDDMRYEATNIGEDTREGKLLRQGASLIASLIAEYLEYRW